MTSRQLQEAAAAEAECTGVVIASITVILARRAHRRHLVCVFKSPTDEMRSLGRPVGLSEADVVLALLSRTEMFQTDSKLDLF